MGWYSGLVEGSDWLHVSDTSVSEYALQAFVHDPVGLAFSLAFAFCFGALWGSFFNVCVARVPRGMSVVKPGSHCFSCGVPVRAIDNIPLVSYLWLRGRCRSCNARFSPRYFVLEALTGTLCLLVFLRFVWMADPGEALESRLVSWIVAFAFIGVLLVLAVIDLDTQTLPDVITLPSVVVFFGLGFFPGFAPSWSARAIGAVGGYLAVRLISDSYYYLRGREGLGLGDAKLLALIGAFLGWQALAPVIFVASLLGVVTAIPALLWSRLGRQRNQSVVAPVSDGGPQEQTDETPVRFTQIPFGPFLAVASVVHLFAAPWVDAWMHGQLAL